MVDYFMVYNFKYDEWALIGAWAATRRNTVKEMLKEDFIQTIPFPTSKTWFGNYIINGYLFFENPLALELAENHIILTYIYSQLYFFCCSLKIS